MSILFAQPAEDASLVDVFPTKKEAAAKQTYLMWALLFLTLYMP